MCGLARDAEALIQELETWFLAHGVMDVLGLCIPNIGCNQILMLHFLNILKLSNLHFAMEKPSGWMVRKQTSMSYRMPMTLIVNKVFSSSQSNQLQ